jgi:hypothetical protein
MLMADWYLKNWEGELKEQSTLQNFPTDSIQLQKLQLKHSEVARF